MDDTIQGIKVPPMKPSKGRGRPSIDWQEMYERWLVQTTYPTVETFLASYGIDHKSRRVWPNVKNWASAEKPQPEASKQLTAHISDETAEQYEENVKRVWSMIRSWRALQAENDYRVGNKLRKAIERKIEIILKEMDEGKEPKTYELVNLSNALEKVQKIQRLSLGMSTDNVGVKSAEEMAREKAAEEIKEKSGTEDDGPIFAVEVNENGKFTRLRPRRVN